MGRTFLRLVGFARPFVVVLALGVACSAAYAGARSLRAYLIKPLLDEVVLPAYGAEPAGASDWISGWLTPGPEAPGPEVPGPEVPGPEVAAPETPAPETAAPGAPDAEAEQARARIGDRVQESFWNIILVALVIVVVIPLAHFGNIYLVAWGMGRVLVEIQQALCVKLLSLPLSFHGRMTRGERLARTTADATRAHNVLSLLFGDLAQETLALVLGVVVLLTISWQLTLATLVMAPLVAGVIAIFGGRIRRTAKRRQESAGDVTQRLVEIFSGIKVIKAFRAHAIEAEGFRRENLRLFRRGMRVVQNRALARTLVEGINNAFGVAVIIGGAIAVALGLWNLTPGGLAAFVGVMATTYRPLKELSKGWALLMDAQPSAERFLELLDAAPEPPDAPDAVRIDGVHRGVRISRVSFSYGREPVLRDVSLDVEAGEMVAIVGRTGAGKTTLADLLLRLYDPDSGCIEIDGVDVRRIARDSLLDQIAVVTQDAFLFSGSIRDNIRYGRPDASDAEVEAAARAAYVDEFVEALPEGYETAVGEVGGRLSGGQRQRITIARALLKNPPILIFDEATSSLDAKSERLVQEAVASLLRGRTTFVIAHRLATVRNADKIVVLEDGRVEAIGSHGDLMASDGLYRELVALQTEGGQIAGNGAS